MALSSLRIAVLGNPDGYYVQDLRRAAGDDLVLEVLSFETLAAQLNAQSWRCWDDTRDDLQSLDGLLVRTMPWGSLEQIIFRVDLLHRLSESGVPVFNSPSSLEIAIDKFRTLSVVQQAGLPIPKTTACQTVGQAMEAFEQLGGEAVVKPMFGGEGRGLMRLDDSELAARAFKTLVQLNAVIYLQEFVPQDGFDVRILVMGDRTWCIRRRHPSDWRTNLSRGGQAEPMVPDPIWIDMARRASQSIGAWMSGVDLLIDSQGRPLVLEVNAVPGWKGLAAALNVDIATDVIRGMTERLSRRDEVLPKKAPIGSINSRNSG